MKPDVVQILQKICSLWQLMDILTLNTPVNLTTPDPRGRLMGTITGLRCRVYPDTPQPRQWKLSLPWVILEGGWVHFDCPQSAKLLSITLMVSP